MKIGPKYKIARRLGAPIFEKTQTPKYALSLARKEKSRGGDRGKPKSEFGRELLEKQKVRLSYGLSEKQFRGYVNRALRSPKPVEKLFSLLESRLDNVLYRAGVSRTRAQARQIASHGHVLVNETRVTIPSILLTTGDTVSLRQGSLSSPLFGEITEQMGVTSVPAWLENNPAKKQTVVKGEAIYLPQEHIFNLGVVIEFYNR